MSEESQFIYRYKYLDFSPGSLETIKSGTIKYSKPSDFNDPFDCNPWYDEELVVNSALETRKDILRKAGKQLKLSPAQRVMYRPKFAANLRRAIKSGDFSTQMNKGIGVVSLTRSPLNILMWSHYAKQHTGFVIELKIPIFGTIKECSALNEWLVPYPVKYRENRPIINILRGNIQQEIDDHVLTKSLEWKYEDEERVIDHIRGHGIHTYKRNEVLCSVIAGLRMQPAEYKMLESTVTSANKSYELSISLHKIREIPKKFALTVDGHPRLDTLKQA